MASTRLVGPDLPSGLRRPDRSVSLPDPRKQPVQRMGGLEEFLFWSRENPRPYGMSGEPRDVSKLSARARDWVESMGFDVDDLHEPMADDLEDMAEAEIAEGDSEEEFDRRQTERTGQIAEEIVRDRRQQVEDAEAAEAAWADAERDASVGDPGWDGFPVEEMRGLTADQAFRQHQATSSAGAMGGLPVNRMAFNFDEFDRLITGGVSEAERNPWDLVEDPKTGELVERRGSSQANQPYERVLRGYDDSELADEIAGLEEWIAVIELIPVEEEDDGLPAGGGVVYVEEGAEARLEAALAEKARRVEEGVSDEGFIGELAPGMVDEARGLTADEAFQQHHAARRINPNQGELPGTGGPREQLEETRGKVPRRTLAEEAAYEEALRKASGERSPGPVVVPPPVPPPVNQMENRNPELRSMDSQMMMDLMAERAAQPEQGYFGGMGNAVQELTETVRAMSGKEQGMMIAALIAAGLLTAGSGGMLAPAGAALMGGAGMAALNQ